MADDLLEDEIMAVSFQVAYDSNSDSGRHEMDVQVLAPALLSLGNLVREANSSMNRNKSKVQLMVQSDFENKCFNIDFQLVQTIFEQIRSLIKEEDVKTAKEILEWLEILKPYGGAGGIGLLTYLGWKKGRKIKQKTAIKDEDKRGMVSIEVGEGASVDTLEVHNNVYMLGENKKILKAISGSLEPIGADDIDRIDIKQNDKIVRTISKEEAVDIQRSCLVLSDADDDDDTPQTVIAHLRVYGPVFDETAENWRFWYGDNIIYADITETDIAAHAIQRGASFTTDTYKVRMEIEEYLTPGGKYKNHYRIKEIIDFIEAAQQRLLPLNDEEE